ncbi:MAG: hypothetical protein ACO23V_07265 [Chitinophagaceae bacterium]
MARFSADISINKLVSTRFLPLFNVGDVEVCKAIIRSCYSAGLRAFELTNRDSTAFDVFCNLVPFVAEEFPELTFGAGTIVDAPTAEKFINAGAEFIVAPIFDQWTLDVCLKSGVPYIPGTFSPTEMFHAHRSGCSMVKLFPAGIVGPEYIKNILAPLPELKIVGTGGVQFDDISVKKWFASGITALGIGSSIFTKERLTKKDYKSIEEDLKRIIAIN